MSDPTLGAALRGAVDLSTLRNRPADAPAGTDAAEPGSGVAVPSLVMDVTDETFAQVLELSRTVPVVVDLWAEWCGPCKQLSPILERVVTELDGRLVLAKVDVDANPQLSQAFRAQSIPMVVALVGGQPVPLFTGAVPEQQVRDVFAQLLQLAAQNGVTGSVTVDGEPAPEEPAEPPLPPLHAEAFEAIESGDYARAIEAYDKALAENPRDAEARAGLGQVRLLDRVQGVDLQEARAAAAAAPTGVDAQLTVADLDLAGGHVDDAFGRLLDLFAQLPVDDRAPVRERLLELFALVGDTDPRVIAARGRLASLLF
ncbi:tetratricopeptide repeat protein [Microbacterium sp. CPCC 204701]|uniref:tetratricopeptide repeat protein n=1 Tax=Microbacterium sp. CPCC 204701 TaxID=2493084 RepID=UPI000FDB1A64|nr:tetratricopeptide repeat protein [Microbacterium sp. CPCC 204701]